MFRYLNIREWKDFLDFLFLDYTQESCKLSMILRQFQARLVPRVNVGRTGIAV